MSRGKYEDNCPGCRPALLDTTTGKPIPEDTPLMQAILKWWETVDRKSKEAFHNCTCLNSKDPEDLKAMSRIIEDMKKAMAKVDDLTN